MQSPRLPVADDFGTESDTRADVERFAPVQQNTDAWKPTWEVFPLKVYRGYDLRVIEIQRDWDDEELLRELGIAYDRLRTWYRKYFSVMNVWWINQHFVFPQRVGPAKISPHRNMRMRYLLAHPEHVKGQHEIMRALTERRDYGVEFVERAEMGRMVLLASALAAFPLGIAIVYGISNGDWPGAFGIAGEPVE
ncbi:hypothetical protein BD309DRAFT_865574 [Dichomitus squalens]|uniref:Uncharacterized protein n=1 Tax=Dichomitus squalens TaxID=114155 RepID=A0A4Q9NPZ0_9APHY|nr:hypothetical protein BD309DRAFT_865574 [Dichomitus squalens]TBU56643.1 hypothetical protein BD310DRAFT_823219 [Dichomitus squalens]